MTTKALVKTKKPAKPRKKRAPNYKWTDDSEGLITDAVLKLGSFTKGHNSLGISKYSFNKYLKAHPNFKTDLTRARVRHDKATDPDRTDLYVTAMESLEAMLTERERVWKHVDLTQLVDAEGNQIEGLYDSYGEPISVFNKHGVQIEVSLREEKIRTSTVDPSMAAIEKVLGKRIIQRVLQGKVYEDRLIKANVPLSVQMLGRWAREAQGDDAEMVSNMNLLSDAMDLFNIRLLQAETRAFYESGELDIKEYSTMILAQTAVYQRMKHSIEQRYAKLVGGKSYYEVVQKFQSYVAEIFKVVNEVVESESVGRKEIVAESIDRLTEASDQQELSILHPGRVRAD